MVVVQRVAIQSLYLSFKVSHAEEKNGKLNGNYINSLVVVVVVEVVVVLLIMFCIEYFCLK